MSAYRSQALALSRKGNGGVQDSMITTLPRRISYSEMMTTASSLLGDGYESRLSARKRSKVRSKATSGCRFESPTFNGYAATGRSACRTASHRVIKTVTRLLAGTTGSAVHIEEVGGLVTTGMGEGRPRQSGPKPAASDIPFSNPVRRFLLPVVTDMTQHARARKLERHVLKRV